MKRSDHVSLCATSVSTANSAANNGKKLRKRRELDKMASVNNSSKNRQSRSNSHSKKLLNIDGNGHLSFSSSDDELDDDDEDDIRHHDGEAYIHLKPSKRGVVGAKYHWLKRNQKLIGFCHKSCYFFVVLSGFLVLLTLAWLHFSLRAQTQDLNAQLRQGAIKHFSKFAESLCIFKNVLFFISVLEDKSNQELNQDQFKSQLELLSQNQTLLHDNLTQIVAQLQQLNSQVLTLNQSISQALTTLRGAPQLKDVPEKISKMNQELGQFGSRLTGIESQVQTLQGDLAKVQTKLKTVDVSTNIDASSSEHLEKVNKFWKKSGAKKLNLDSLFSGRLRWIESWVWHQVAQWICSFGN